MMQLELISDGDDEKRTMSVSHLMSMFFFLKSRCA